MSSEELVTLGEVTVQLRQCPKESGSHKIYFWTTFQADGEILGATLPSENDDTFLKVLL